jgi:hypothetical protein
MADTGIIKIHGKDYQTVALRVKEFRKAHPNLGLRTQMVRYDDEAVMCRAEIWDNEFLLATGHAEERRSSSSINKTSALENCETSAIGRALAALGFGGTEFASANEVESVESRVEPIDDAKAATLELLINETGSNIAKFCEHFDIKKVSDLPETKYQSALNALKAKKKHREPGAEG